MEKRGVYNRLWYSLFLLPLFYRPILGIALVFFLPGLGIILSFFKNSKAHEKIALSIALSISITVLTGFFLNATFGLNFATVFTSLMLITIISFAVFFKRKGREWIKNFKIPKPTKKQIFQIAMVLICLSVLAVKIHQPHQNNPYPIHLDEWSRLLETTHIIEQESFNNRYNPQFVGHPDAPRRLNPGFQFILSQFYIVSGVDHIEFFQYLPALFAVMTGFILFSFLFKISNYWTGLFGIIFISFMKTNDNTLGIALLLALTMTFPLLYAIFYSLYNSFEKKESFYLLLASLFYFTVLVTHEQTGAAFMPIILLYIIIKLLIFLFKRESLDFSLKGIIIALISFVIPLFSLYVARHIIWKGSIEKSFSFLLDLIVWGGVSPIRFSYNFILFYGTILSILAVIGAILVFRNLNMQVFVLWAIFTVWQIINFRLNQITYFSALERIRHHALLGLIPLSAYGAFSILEIVSKFFKEKKEIILAVLSVVLILTASIVTLTTEDEGLYFPEGKVPRHGVGLVPTLKYQDYQAILFLKNITNKQVVLAKPLISAAIYPISYNYVVATDQTPGDGFGGGNLQAVRRFFTTPSCIEKQNIAYRNNARYILSERPINCGFVDQIYSEEFRYIYKAK